MESELKKISVFTGATWKVLGLAYNRRETRDKQPFGRDPDSSWCNFHTSIKLFWSQAMSPWTSAEAYECAAAQFMDPSAEIKKDLP